MTRPCVALGAMLAALTGSLLLIESGCASELTADHSSCTRGFVCPLAHEGYFGCEFGIGTYDAPARSTSDAADLNGAELDESELVDRDVDASDFEEFNSDESYADVESPSVDEFAADSDGNGVDEWDYFDDAQYDEIFCFDGLEDELNVGSTLAASEAAPTVNAHITRVDRDPFGVSHCLAGYDPSYDMAVYGVCNAPTTSASSEESGNADAYLSDESRWHVEPDYEVTMEEYAERYPDVSTVDQLRGGHIVIADFPDRVDHSDDRTDAALSDESPKTDESATTVLEDDIASDLMDAVEADLALDASYWNHPDACWVDDFTPASEVDEVSDVPADVETVNDDTASSGPLQAGSELDIASDEDAEAAPYASPFADEYEVENDPYAADFYFENADSTDAASPLNDASSDEAWDEGLYDALPTAEPWDRDAVEAAEADSKADSQADSIESDAEEAGTDEFYYGDEYGFDYGSDYEYEQVQETTDSPSTSTAAESDAASAIEPAYESEYDSTLESDYGDGYEYGDGYGYELENGTSSDYEVDGNWWEAAEAEQIESAETLDSNDIDSQLHDSHENDVAFPLADFPVVESRWLAGAAMLADASPADGIAMIGRIDFVARCRDTAELLKYYRRTSHREEMIEYYGLDDDEYAWADTQGYYANYYAEDSAAEADEETAEPSGLTSVHGESDSAWRRAARGCGRDAIIDAADAMDRWGLALLRASLWLTDLAD